MTTKELRQLISAHFDGQDWSRLWFCFRMVGHAGKNIAREYLRKLGFPESPGSKQNWVDYIALLISLIPLALILIMIFSCPL